MIEFTFRVPIYNVSVLIISGEMQEMDNFLISHGIDNDPSDDRCTVYSGTDYGYSKKAQILAAFKNGHNVLVGELAHESFHIVYYILKRAGCRLSDDSEEAYAYLMEYVVKAIRVGFINENLKKNEINDTDTTEKV